MAPFSSITSNHPKVKVESISGRNPNELPDQMDSPVIAHLVHRICIQAEEHQRAAALKEEEPMPLDVQRELARLTGKDDRRKLFELELQLKGIQM